MYCQKCGNQIDDKASVCPECGTPTGINGNEKSKPKKQKKKHPILITVVVLIVAVLIFAGLSGGDAQDNGPKKVSSGNTVAAQTEQTAASAQNDVFTVGDAVALDGVTVTLKNVTESSGKDYTTPADGNVFIICEFEIENGSESDISVSSMMSFEAYIDDYSTTLSLSAIMAANKSQLDGSVAVGKKMSGVVGYEVSKDWKELEVRYVPNPFLEDAIIFTYSK